MPDGWEVQYGLNPLDASDGDEDGDADGLTNLGEYQEGTNPTNPDTDSDGMPDGWEVQYGLDPLNPSDADGDGDGDGLTNVQEYGAGTDPANPDTDSDGLSDGWEVQHGTNPLNPDTDSDGMPDGWEVQYGLDPLDPSDADADNDGDGFTNLEEYVFGTDPTELFTDHALLLPNGGEEIPSGTSYTIRWGAPPEAVSFKLRYSLNNGRKWKLIGKGISGRRYDWRVPTPKKNVAQCLVMVIGYDTAGKKVGSDKSDGTYTIQVLRVTSPTGGETLSSGGIHTITWTTNGTRKPAARVILRWSQNGGRTWKKIDALTGNPGSYDWKIPDLLRVMDRCRVKVILKDAGGKKVANDTSNGSFTIEPKL
jgi:hypothetical protein